ncbi:hypothetical protein GCM10023146_29510 [Nocardioides caricicola]
MHGRKSRAAAVAPELLSSEPFSSGSLPHAVMTDVARSATKPLAAAFLKLFTVASIISPVWYGATSGHRTESRSRDLPFAGKDCVTVRMARCSFPCPV